MYQFRMPSLGADMEAGTLVEWDKHPGDAVKRGDIVAVVETDKGAIEVEVFVNGTMGKQLVPLGEKVPVGTPLAEIEGVEGEEEHPQAAPPPEAAAPAAPEAAPPAPKSVAVPAPSTPVVPAGLRASPAARRLAAQRGIKLETLKGTGPGGTIVLHDVEQAGATEASPKEAASEPAAPKRGLDLSKMRQAIAAAMAKSKREIPHYYLATNIDMSVALAWLEKTNAERTPEARLLPAVVTLKAVALACKKFPALNGFYDPETGFSPGKDVHIGVAVAIRGGGLVSPAIHDCDDLTLDQLMAAVRDLVARAREGRLRSSELSDSTITVSSLGERGVESLYGIIYPPQVALVGFGTVTRKPMAVGDGNALEARPVMTATLAADHRVSDGHVGARFLREINARLQEPDKL